MNNLYTHDLCWSVKSFLLENVTVDLADKPHEDNRSVSNPNSPLSGLLPLRRDHAIAESSEPKLQGKSRFQANGLRLNTKGTSLSSVKISFQEVCKLFLTILIVIQMLLWRRVLCLTKGKWRMERCPIETLGKLRARRKMKDQERFLICFLMLVLIQ